MKVILIIGPQGSGKGTQAELISKKYNLLNISAGDIIREQMKNNKKYKEEVKKIVNSGELISDELIYKFILDYLKNNNKKEGIILDGYPRNINQAKDFDKICQNLNCKLTNVIHLEISKEEVFKRLEGRRICSFCGSIYNIYTNPPITNNLCDIDKGELIKREDDTEESINKRLTEYYKQTEPLIEFYRKRSIVIDIDATLDITEVFTQIKEEIND